MIRNISQCFQSKDNTEVRGMPLISLRNFFVSFDVTNKGWTRGVLLSRLTTQLASWNLSLQFLNHEITSLEGKMIWTGVIFWVRGCQSCFGRFFVHTISKNTVRKNRLAIYLFLQKWSLTVLGTIAFPTRVCKINFVNYCSLISQSFHEKLLLG